MPDAAVALARRSPAAPPRALDATAMVCLLAGNTIGGWIFPAEWMVAGVFPPVLIGLALVAIRCALWPRPSLFATCWSTVAGVGLTRRLVAIAVITRAAVLVVGIAASVTHPLRIDAAPRISDNPIVNLPARWDAFWYLGTARYGYEWHADEADKQQNIAFFPAYPLVMRVAGDLITIPAQLFQTPAFFGNGDGRVLWGGALASMAFFALSLGRIRRIAIHDGDASSADRACVLLAAYPFALFYSGSYSEALALFAVTSLVLAWKRGDPRGAWWGVLFGLTRPNGWCVAAALAADRLGRRAAIDSRAAWALVASAPVGAAIYSGYVFHLTGHPLQWAAAQHAWGGSFQPAQFFVRRWTIVNDHGLRWYLRRDPADVLSFAAAIGTLAIAVWLIVKREWLGGLFIVAYLAPAVLIDLPAVGRITSLLFPAFVVLGRRVKGAPFVALTTLFAAGEVWMAWRFFQWRTPY